MGTNFYARIIPTKERKDKLKELIDKDDFDGIKSCVNEMYGSFEAHDGNETVSGEVHLGKRSGGWKFLWNPNIYLIRNGHVEWKDNGNGCKSCNFIPEPDTAYYVYELTKDAIKSFIDREDVVIYDEYGEKQDKEKFWEEALNWTTWNGKEAFDSKMYDEYERKKDPGYKTYKCRGDYIDLLEKEGFKFCSESKSDFYSDGLRFASNNNFS